MANSQRRITKELAEVTSDPPAGVTVSLANESNVHEWNIMMDGPPGTPYAGGKFKLLLVLPTDYPFKAPTLNFKTKIWHPNVTFDEKGSMCLGMLKGDVWKPSSKIMSILTAAQQLLVEPNPDDAVEASIAQKFKEDKAGFIKEAQEYTKKYAN
ncbi:putative ubiquitin-protein ligase-2 [Coleophoma crateriformis]|uniref:E2 ubiquitin-conjugating enzyme n=2 Tax=Coleophoma TaxID=453209 RepID=A0A3D8SSF4_9HELO|nr:putative ubiquitin-protein ligase-2 [Coleophoma crateriformis]RDW89225.1 putative ubiquitin-protein ligase-2 [Coleophoma cylindrospora]